MTSLPIPICPPDSIATAQGPGAAHDCLANDHAANDRISGERTARDGVASDGQFLLAAFHSFSEAASSLERSYAHLRAEVERLRAELNETHQKLQREQALAEMSAVLAHEIRNPLASLELFAELLAEADLAAECREWVEHVQAGLRTLMATVNNVLHFHTPAEPAPPASAFAPVDLGRLLEWARNFLAPLARQAGVTLSLQNRLLGVEYPADRHGLEQVLLNLVLNSLRALAGDGWIELGGQLSGDGSAVEFFVADTGPGIAPEHVPHLFEPGFSTRSGCAGLGLAVCQRIVAAHGGTILAATHPNGGALFTVRLPLAGYLSGHFSGLPTGHFSGNPSGHFSGHRSEEPLAVESAATASGVRP